MFILAIMSCYQHNKTLVYNLYKKPSPFFLAGIPSRRPSEHGVAAGDERGSRAETRFSRWEKRRRVFREKNGLSIRNSKCLSWIPAGAYARESGCGNDKRRELLDCDY